MAEYVGKTLFLKFGSTTLSGDFRNFDAEEEVGLVDSSAGNDTARTYLTTMEDGNATAELVDQTGGSALWLAIKKGTYGTLEWGPEGTTAGKPKHSVYSVVQSRKRTFPFDDLAVITAEFQFSGTVTDGTY